MDRTQAPLLVERRQDGIVELRLNRPEARNALSMPLLAELQAALDRIASDVTVRVVILAGVGPAFCAGHDLREVRGLDARGIEAVFERCSAVMQTLMRLPQPVIAKVHGVATAAGCQLVASCDLAVAAETARFATPGVNIGLFCSTPMVALTRNIGRKQAMEMLLLGELIDAATGLRLGLLNRVVPTAELDGAVLAMAQAIAGKSPLTLKLGKAAFYRQLEMPVAEAYAYTSRVMLENMLARDAGEGIDAFLEKRPAVWQGR